MTNPTRGDERGSRSLDPRTFPVERIADLVHALPPPGVAIDVADVPGAAEAVVWLAAHGRPARLVPAPLEPRETRLWEPSPALASYVAMVSRPSFSGEAKTALDLGCGTGRDAVYLALHGWRVTAVDRLPDALDRARSLAALHGVVLDLRLVDVERAKLPLSSPRRQRPENDPLASGDERGLGGELITGFDLVTAFRYLPSLDLMAGALVPGGTLLVETFTDRDRERTGKPKDPRLVLPSAVPPALPEGLILVDYRVREYAGRELATLQAEAWGPGAD